MRKSFIPDIYEIIVAGTLEICLLLLIRRPMSRSLVSFSYLRLMEPIFTGVCHKLLPFVRVIRFAGSLSP